MGLFSGGAKSAVGSGSTESEQIKAAILAQTRHITVGKPGRPLDELEMALGFAAALRWFGQLTFLKVNNEKGALQFSENQITTSTIAVAMILTGACQDADFEASIRRIRPRFDPGRELRAVLGIESCADQSNHLVNAVIIAAREFVKAFLAGESSAIVHIVGPLSPAQQISLAMAWINTALSIPNCEVYLPTDTALALSGKSASFDPDLWNELCDHAVASNVIVGYRLHQLDSGLVRHLRAQGLMSAEEEMSLRAKGMIS